MKLGKPTDTEYIQAFRNNNNDIVTLFYRQYRADFKDFVKAFVKKKDITISDEDIDRIFQDTISRLWEKIQRGSFNEDKLEKTLFDYCNGIAKNVIYEYLRQNQKIVNTDVDLIDQQGETDEDEINTSFTSIRISKRQVWDESVWIDMVERPYSTFILYPHSDEECYAEWERLTEEYEKYQRHKKKDFYTESTAHIPTVREKLVETIVNNMGKPCAPLLNLFYWEKKSWAAIATELEYSGADSAKTQKAKCMSKLKKIVENQLKAVTL